MLIGSGLNQMAAFVDPQNGQAPIDANQVRGNDNTLRERLNQHDADQRIHVQSGTATQRPAPLSTNSGTYYFATDTGVLSVSTGTAWSEVAYLRLSGGTLTGNLTVPGLSLGANGLLTSLLFGADNTHDVGATASGRPRDLFVARDAVVGRHVTVAENLTTGRVLQTAASSADAGRRAPLVVPHGAVPNTLENGAIWTTTDGMFVRINGVTVGPLGSGGGGGGIGGGGTTGRSAMFTGAATIGSGSFDDDGTTLTARVRLNLQAGATGSSSLRMPHGAAPTTPVDGDMWTTTDGLFVRVNGNTVGPLGATAGTISGSGTANSFALFTGTASVGNAGMTQDTEAVYVSNRRLVCAASTTGRASLHLGAGTQPSAPVQGDLWFDGAHLHLRTATTTLTLTDPRAPLDASYVVLGANAVLPNERVLAAGAGISITDNGAGNSVVIAATGGGLGGSGTTNTVSKFTAANTLGNSLITDDGTTIGLGGNVTLGTSASSTIALTGRISTHVTFSSDGASDIGASGANRPRHYFGTGSATLGGNLTVGGAASITGTLTSGNVNVAAITASGKITAPASTASVASLNIPHGVAPSTAANGDIWTTTDGVFARINGVVVRIMTSADMGSVVTVLNETSKLPASRRLTASGMAVLTDGGPGFTVNINV